MRRKADRTHGSWMKLCMSLLTVAISAVAGEVLHWDFEEDVPAHGGAFAVYREGEKPTFAEEACAPRIWDGGSYTAVVEDNRRSVYFANVASDSLAPVGGEIVLDGSRKEFRLPALTVECFVRVEKQVARFALLASKRRLNGSSWSLAVEPGGTVMARFDTQEGASGPGFNRTVSTGKTIADGEWHHVAMTFDDKPCECRLFIDYRLCASARTSGPLVYDEGKLTIGRGLNGWIDEARLSDTVLHPEQFLRPTRFFTDLQNKKRREPDAMIDLTPTRVQTSVSLDWEKIGTLYPKSLDEIPGDFWSLGCETLDRDLANWDAYKRYLQPLGISRIRLQGGWAKTEKERGVYDFEWLDAIVDSAHELGLTVCLETSYGNRLYEPGAGLGPGGTIPAGDDVLAAWDAWVEAMARHYAPKGVREWMMYNEPNLNRKNTPEAVVAFNARTAEVIKRVDPDAKVAGLVASGVNAAWIEKWLEGLRDMGKLDLFEWVIYHGYGANPDSLVPGMQKVKALVREYSPTLKLWQGEAGCASEEVQYALSGIDWTEISHAKWNARRMLCDFGHEIESTVFTISDLSYHKDFISRYGLLKTAPDNSIIKVKTAYYVVNNVVSVFNGSVTVNPAARVSVTPEDGMVCYSFKDTKSGSDLIALWDASSIPVHECDLATVDLAVERLAMNDPVWLDLLTGRIYEVPGTSIVTAGNITSLTDIPIFDSPVVLTDRSVLSFVEARKPKTPTKRAVRPIPKRSAKENPASALRAYRLFSAQKPAPAVVIASPAGGVPNWSDQLAAQLRSEGIHAFVRTDASAGIADTVSYIRSQATAWQVDPEQIGLLGTPADAADYRGAGANFAVVLGVPPDSSDANTKALPDSVTTSVPGPRSTWLTDLLKWLEPRKTKVF